MKTNDQAPWAPSYSFHIYDNIYILSINVNKYEAMYIVGIDEVGRGSLAGPVIVAVVLTPKEFYPKPASLPKLRDSKMLTPDIRAAWFAYIKTHPDIFYTTSGVYPRGIEKHNISGAANLAALRAFSRLTRNINSINYSVFLDGGLYIGNKNNLGVPAKTIIRGDQKIVTIKLASIVAKVTRDRYMVRLHSKHPEYHFCSHMGYGTSLHRRMIKKHGASNAHRKAFLQKI